MYVDAINFEMGAQKETLRRNPGEFHANSEFPNYSLQRNYFASVAAASAVSWAACSAVGFLSSCKRAALPESLVK